MFFLGLAMAKVTIRLIQVIGFQNGVHVHTPRDIKLLPYTFVDWKGKLFSEPLTLI